MTGTGPLHGIRVVEFAGIGPGPHACMILADLGADVVRVQRAGDFPAEGTVADQLLRGRTAIEANLKDPSDLAEVTRLLAKADVLVEGFRPGVMERLGLGPTEVAAINPALIYGRMTGWGQEGPMADRAGHDINYISLTGILGAVGRVGERPVPPLNLAGDFGGGSLFLVIGVLAALTERQKSGLGQVIDAAMVDGASVLAQMMWAFRGTGLWSDERGTNLLDTGAHFYEVYETKDGKYMSTGAIEPQFYAQLLTGLALDPATLPHQLDQSQWPAMKLTFAEVFKTKTRDEWAAIFDGTDACTTPVLDWSEAPAHAHMAARGNLVESDGVIQAAAAPRFSRTTTAAPVPPARSAAAHGTLWTD